MANTFDVNTMNGSVVRPKIAGMESTAKITSVVSTINNTIARGVSARRPSTRAINFCPSKVFATGYTFWASRMTGFRSEEHTSELQSHSDLVCRLLLEKKKKKNK